tara:strand:+ start:170 stop:379 length:210 start_codon:yes stop_codon:yes gene_type:complete
MDEKYDHYKLLSVEDLVICIKRKDMEIKNLKQKVDETNKLKNMYYQYNNFHIEEISRLDIIIGDYKTNK